MHTQLNAARQGYRHILALLTTLVRDPADTERQQKKITRIISVTETLARALEKELVENNRANRWPGPGLPAKRPRPCPNPREN
jgi:hypothetical protein